MAKQRYINTKFWSDAYIADLDPTEKLLFIYLLSNERTNLSGVYELPIKFMATETGIDRDMVIKILERFESDGKIKHANGWVRIVNAPKHQHYTNIKIKQGIENEISQVPTPVKDALQIGHIYPIHETSHIDRDRDRDTNVIRTSPTAQSASKITFKKKSHGNPEVQGILKLAKTFGLTNNQLDTYATKRLVTSHGYETVKELLTESQKLRRVAMAPQITSLVELERKWVKLSDYLQVNSSDGIPQEVLAEIKADEEQRRKTGNYDEETLKRATEMGIKMYKETGRWK